jgi:hypothetical protein
MVMRRPFVPNAPPLFEELLDRKVPLGERVLTFARKHGGLFGEERVLFDGGGGPKPEDLFKWRDLIRQMEFILREKLIADQPIATVHLKLRKDRRGAALDFAPSTMHAALMMECAVAATTDSFKWCRYCDMPFTGKKASAQFCSTRCRDNFHNHMKAAART